MNCVAGLISFPLQKPLHRFLSLRWRWKLHAWNLKINNFSSRHLTIPTVFLPTQSILSGLSFFQQHTYALSLIYLAVIPILLIYIGFLLLRPLHILFFLPAMPTSTISMKRFIWTAGITSFFLHRRKVSGRLS